ncbi:hypothetical protein K8O93_01055 [Gordonia bronchialis]|uniref:hypothetical protein n=1 Tax=Gordonia bronchialis TaxID=2054 RepID=UPI001CC0740E|nr:hypothetical protein [Gordonia bronchialis]UAK38422.1 hypothetical protein K8O93_01055 [Gordonia bronchialis]
MDPDAALANARDALARFRKSQADGALLHQNYAAIDLTEAFAALDEWLTNGGFLPASWLPVP